MNIEIERIINASHQAKTKPEVAQQKKLDSAIQVLASYSVDRLEPLADSFAKNSLLIFLQSVLCTSAASQGQPLLQSVLCTSAASQG